MFWPGPRGPNRGVVGVPASGRRSSGAGAPAGAPTAVRCSLGTFGARVDRARVCRRIAVTLCRTGQRWLEAAAARHCHVALVELVLPQVTGLELAAHLKSAPETAKVAVIIHTNWVTPEARASAAVAGIPPASAKAALGIVQGPS